MAAFTSSWEQLLKMFYLVAIICCSTSPVKSEYTADLRQDPNAPPSFNGFLIRQKAASDMGAQSVMSASNSTPKYSADILSQDALSGLAKLGYREQDLTPVGTQGWVLAKPPPGAALRGRRLHTARGRSLRKLLDDFSFYGLEAEPNYILTAQQRVPNDPLFSSVSKSMQQISADLTWIFFRGSRRVIKVCVIDSGLDSSHPDLQDSVGQVYNAITGKLETPGSVNDPYGHGTHCAGTIGAIGNNSYGISGVSWNVNLLGCKFMDAEGKGDTASAIACIEWCRQQGASITSNSWGRYGSVNDSNALKSEIAVSQAAGHLFITAAGNENRNIDNGTFVPGGLDMPAIITVGAVDPQDNRAPFSNYGSKTVHLFAPGVNIYSTSPGKSFSLRSGTSMAVPHVAGAAALLWSYNPTASAADIKTAILGGVDLLSGAALSSTRGRLNVLKSWAILAGREVSSPSPSPLPPPPPTSRLAPPPPTSRLPPPPQPSRLPPTPRCRDSYPQWCYGQALSGYCGWTWYGTPIGWYCPQSCGRCGTASIGYQCRDEEMLCQRWARDGYCQPWYYWNTRSVDAEVCPASCGKCQQSGTLTAMGMDDSGSSLGQSEDDEKFVVQEVIQKDSAWADISGIWSTGEGSPDMYIQFDVSQGTGYALWLSVGTDPPQSLTITAKENKTLLLMDSSGNSYFARAEGVTTSGAKDAKAPRRQLSPQSIGSLVFGFGSIGRSMLSWVKKGAASGSFRRYISRAGDTLSVIADLYQIGVGDLIAANPQLEYTDSNSKLREGTRMILPGGEDASPPPPPPPRPRPRPDYQIIVFPNSGSPHGGRPPARALLFLPSFFIAVLLARGMPLL